MLPAADSAGPACAAGGSLRTTLYGTVSADIDWAGSAMSCEGMPRPNGAGARLRFAGAADENALAIIIGIPAFADEEAIELPSNVTVIVEGNGRFFSTSGLDSCWTDVTAISESGDNDHEFRVDGRLYCISPLTEVNGDGSVLINELTFSGRLDREAG